MCIATVGMSIQISGKRIGYFELSLSGWVRPYAKVDAIKFNQSINQYKGCHGGCAWTNSICQCGCASTEFVRVGALVNKLWQVRHNTHCIETVL